jgi:hypothetical protein
MHVHAIIGSTTIVYTFYFGRSAANTSQTSVDIHLALVLAVGANQALFLTPFLYTAMANNSWSSIHRIHI